MKTKTFKKIATVENSFEADLVTEALRQQAIPHIVRSYRDTAYDGIFMPQKGWGAIMVYEEDEDRAHTVIDDLRRDYRISAGKQEDPADLP